MNEVLETKPPERTWGFTRWRSQPWRVIVLGVVVALVFFMHQTTRDVRLPDGTHIELLGILRNTSFDMQRGGARSRSLVVKYYSAETEPDAMRREAVGLAQYFFSIADDAGVTVLYMEASRPLLTRHLPIVTISRNVRFEKYGVGDWEEVRR